MLGLVLHSSNCASPKPTGMSGTLSSGSCQPENDQATGASWCEKNNAGQSIKKRVPEASLSAQEPEEEEVSGIPRQAAVTQDSDAHPTPSNPHTLP